MKTFVLSDAVRAYWFVSQCIHGRRRCTTEYAIRELNNYIPRMNPERPLHSKMCNLMGKVIQPRSSSNHAQGNRNRNCNCNRNGNRNRNGNHNGNRNHSGNRNCNGNRNRNDNRVRSISDVNRPNN